VICIDTNKKPTCETTVLTVTKETVSEGNIRVGKLLGNLIPGDVLGSPNRKNGRGTDIELVLSGLNRIVETDVPQDKKIFRHRVEIREFVRHHNLRPGDRIYLERINGRQFRIRPVTKQLTFIDLFAGIGGMRLAFENAGGKCVFSSEWDESACKTYEANFGEKPHGDMIPADTLGPANLIL
jgi:DNA (cytosine-5)-methyltransferase 1